MIKKLLLPLLFFLGTGHAQNVRFSTQVPSITTIGSVPYLVANVPPNSPVLAVCNVPANAVPCTNYAQTFNSAGTACPNGAQDTPDPQPSSCQSTGDAQGNIGFFVAAGNYDYTVCIQTTCLGPYRVTLSSGTGIAGTPVSPTAPNFGDALCFNLYGDNQWDICPLPRYIQVFADGSNPPIQLGHGNAPGTSANHSMVGETATESPAETFNTTAAASTNVTAAITQGFNGSNDAIFSLGTTFRLTTRVVFNSTTNVRYWWGLFRKNSNGNTTYATDAPNFPTAAFRYSAGTDTTVKAYVATDSTHFTVVDTGIALNTAASVIYDVVNTGTAITFRINGVNVATISTNYPGAATQIAPAVFCDNKNTANDVSFTFWYWTQLLK